MAATRLHCGAHQRGTAGAAVAVGVSVLEDDARLGQRVNVGRLCLWVAEPDVIVSAARWGNTAGMARQVSNTASTPNWLLVRRWQDKGETRSRLQVVRKDHAVVGQW